MFSCIRDFDDFNTIRQIALQTWPSAYGHIISQEQLDYMLEMMYSIESLTRQKEQASHRFFLCVDEKKIPTGFASISALHNDCKRYKLHKLYVLPEYQQKGAGKKLLEDIFIELKHLNAFSLELNVNRNNKAIHFYQKSGFEIIREEDIDIGEGFFMNDYVMLKKV